MTDRRFIQALRFSSFIEGLSWLALIAAMIYRSQTGDHEPVSQSGKIHGQLFCLFGVTLLVTWLKVKWSLTFAFLIGLTSLFPLGFIVADHYLRKKLTTSV